MAEGAIIGAVIFAVGFIAGKKCASMNKPADEIINAFSVPVRNDRITTASTQPDFSEKAVFITPNRTQEILMTNPDATIDDMLV